MKSLAVLAVLAVLGLAGCGGSGKGPGQQSAYDQGHQDGKVMAQNGGADYCDVEASGISSAALHDAYTRGCHDALAGK